MAPSPRTPRQAALKAPRGGRPSRRVLLPTRDDASWTRALLPPLNPLPNDAATSQVVLAAAVASSIRKRTRKPQGDQIQRLRLIPDPERARA
ncbi:hypothetical protein PG987_002514 [Apiospora arundinis]